MVLQKPGLANLTSSVTPKILRVFIPANSNIQDVPPSLHNKRLIFFARFIVKTISLEINSPFDHSGQTKPSASHSLKNCFSFGPKKKYIL